jgi:fermentation-respiration switch protein FrsA (DUF1100 family)
MRDWDWLRPHTLNLYEYTANDPVNMWDPDGFEVISLDLTDAQRDRLLEELSLFSGYSTDFVTNDDGSTTAQGLYFNEDGQLQIAEGAIISEDGSENAANFLKEVVDSEDSIVLRNAIDPGSVQLGRANENFFGEVQLDFGDFSTPGAIKYSKNVPALTFGLGSNALHEMYHAHTGIRDSPTLDQTDPSPVVNFVNEMRADLGIPLRQPERYSASGSQRKMNLFFYKMKKNGKYNKVGKVKLDGKLLRPNYFKKKKK